MPFCLTYTEAQLAHFHAIDARRPHWRFSAARVRRCQELADFVAKVATIFDAYPSEYCKNILNVAKSCPRE